MGMGARLEIDGLVAHGPGFHLVDGDGGIGVEYAKVGDAFPGEEGAGDWRIG